MTQHQSHSQIIAQQNDRFRQSYMIIADPVCLHLSNRSNLAGEVFITDGISALDCEEQNKIFQAVHSFDNFNPDNDPYGEYDFGVIEIVGHKVFWKIDYYDPSRTYGSEVPHDPAQTYRVLTIMLSSEY